MFTGDDILSPVSGSFFKVDVNITRLEIIDDDVTQVFTFPYLISGYHNVVEEAGAITRARNSQVLINQTLTVDTTFRFEGNLVIDLSFYCSARIDRKYEYNT